MMACPAHTNAAVMWRSSRGEFEEAYRTAVSPIPWPAFAAVSARILRDRCRRGEIDKPIAIRALKRFLTERHGPESRHPVDVNAGRTQPRLPSA